MRRVDVAKDVLCVRAPARVHFGLLDMGASGNRIDGGFGLMLDGPATEVTIREAHKRVGSPEDYSLSEIEKSLKIELPRKVNVSIESSIVPHTGLGRGTQVRLAIGAGLLAAANRKVRPEHLATALGRSGTSGIGSWGFWTGGYVIDGGHDRRKKSIFEPSSAVGAPHMPPLVRTGKFPWHCVIGTAANLEKIYGEQERALFKLHTPVPDTETNECYRILYGHIIPSLIENDFEEFCLGVKLYQSRGFKMREIACQGDQAGKAFKDFAAAGLRGVSMSSWGPTFIGFAASYQVARSAERTLMGTGNYSGVMLTKSSDFGATISVNDEFAFPVADVLMSHEFSRNSGAYRKLGPHSF